MGPQSTDVPRSWVVTVYSLPLRVCENSLLSPPDATISTFMSGLETRFLFTYSYFPFSFSFIRILVRICRICPSQTACVAHQWEWNGGVEGRVQRTTPTKGRVRFRLTVSELHTSDGTYRIPTIFQKPPCLPEHQPNRRTPHCSSEIRFKTSEHWFVCQHL